MTPDMIRTGLPDPDHDAAFYEGIPAKRFVAWIVDVVIISIISLILGLLTLTLLLWIWPILYLGVSFLYRAATIGSGSATLGMRLMSIELRNAQGLRFSPTEAVVHTGLYLFWSVSLILQFISIGLILASPRHQGLHDHILGTAAINRPR